MIPTASDANNPKAGLGWTPPEPIECRLETPRLLIRAYTLEDAPELFGVIRDSLGHLLPWMAWAPGHSSLAFTTRYVTEQILAQADTAKFDGMGVGIFEKESGDLVGATGVHDVRRPTASCETGYWLRHDRVGRGYATEACARVLSWALADQHSGGLGLRRVRIFCAAANAASARVPARLGLTPELRQRQELYIEGLGPSDRLGWGVLREEWDCEHHRRAKQGAG